MSNEVEIKQEVELLKKGEEDLSIYNSNASDDIVALSLIVKKIRTDKNSFKSIKVMMYLPCYSSNGFEGYNNRKIDVHFTKSAFDNVYEGCKIHKPDDLSTGTLFVRKKGIQAPSKYEVKVDDKGNKEYPQVWIKSDIIGFKPYTLDDEVFTYHKPVKDAEYEVIEETDEDFKGLE